MDIRQLTYFITIAEEGQITAAAKKLHMAQPPLSQQMKALEKELGVQLLIREPRRVTLTDAGQLLYHRAKQIVGLTDSTRRELCDFQSGQRGTLSIGTVSSSGSVILSPALKTFQQNHGGIRFEIYDGNTFQVLDMLRKGLIEIGIVRTPFSQDNLRCTFLPEEPMILAFRPEKNVFGPKKAVSLPELTGKPLILYRRFDKLFHDVCMAQNIQPTIFCRNDDARTSLLWAKAGLGYAVVPFSALAPAGLRQLQYKIIDEEKLRTRLAIIQPRQRYISTIARQFIEAIQQTLP